MGLNHRDSALFLYTNTKKPSNTKKKIGERHGTHNFETSRWIQIQKTVY